MSNNSLGPDIQERARVLLKALLDYDPKWDKEEFESILKNSLGPNLGRGYDRTQKLKFEVYPSSTPPGRKFYATKHSLLQLTSFKGERELSEEELPDALRCLSKFEILADDKHQGKTQKILTLGFENRGEILTRFEQKCRERNESKNRGKADPWAKMRKLVPSEFDLLDEKFLKTRGRGEAHILKLPAATWSMIRGGGYIDRDRQEDALALAQDLARYDGISLLLIRGLPGAGKTALTRWLAYQLFCQQQIVLQKKPRADDYYSLDSLWEFSEGIGERHFYLIADDLFRDDALVEALEANELQFPLTFIGTSRLNEDRQDRLLRGGYRMESLDLELYPEEKERIRQRVCEQDAAAKARLEGMSSAALQKLMAAPSMLVLMLQLAEGKGFDVTVADLIKRLPSEADYPVYQVFGVICSFYQYGIAMPPEVLPLCLPEYSQKAVRKAIDLAPHSELKGLVKTTKRFGCWCLATIHELIAEIAITVKYPRSREENLPYSANSLKEHLMAAIPVLDVSCETHKRWAYHSLRLLAVNGEAELVRSILSDYPEEIHVLQQGSAVTGWFIWGKMYQVLGLWEERDRCLNAILLTNPESPGDFSYWLSRVKSCGSSQQKQEAIAETATWLPQHPDDKKVRCQYLALMGQYGSSQQKQEAIAQTATWLLQHPNDTWVRTKYLALIGQCGNSQQKQEAIAQTATWLPLHPNDAWVRTQYLALIGQCGSSQQKQEAIAQTATWLLQHPDDKEVRCQYLALIRKCGSFQQKQEAIAETATWLQQHPDNQDVRTQYLAIVAKAAKDIIEIEPILCQQWQWISQQARVDQSLLEAFLSVLGYHAKFRPNLVPLIQPAIDLALKQYPENKNIVRAVFGYFRDYLDYQTCSALADTISQHRFTQYVNSWQHFIYAANFFRDYGELDKAEAIYQTVIKTAKKSIKKRWANADRLKKTINFASLSYARLFILREPPNPSQAIEYLKLTLKKNPQHELAYCYMAQCYQAQGENFYPQAIESFQRVIELDREKKGYFWYEFGCFYRDAIKNPTEASNCFANSLKQKTNLPACIALAELELQEGKRESARELLERGLALIPITRPEKEEREQLTPRIQALETQLGIKTSHLPSSVIARGGG